MKTIALINWGLLALYALMLLGVLIFSRPTTSDSRMATGFLIMLFVPLAVLALINILPFPFTRIFVLVLSAAPLVMGLIMLIAGPIIQQWRTRTYEDDFAARENGSYYFRDPAARQVAAAIAAIDTNLIRESLQQPVPDLNASGSEHITLFDFAAMQAIKATPEQLIPCFEILYQKGARFQNNDGAHSPTHFLAVRHDPALLRWFLEKGADANAREAGTGSPILFSAIHGDNSDTAKTEKVRLLLEHGADPNVVPAAQDERVIVTSMLLSAASSELWDICDLMLDHGADPAYHTESGWDIFQAVAYQARQFQSWGKTPPEAFVRLSDRLGEISATAGKRKPQ